MGWYTEPTSPAWEVLEQVVPSEWLQIGNDDEQHIYITSLDALNLPTGPLGDWHPTSWTPPAGSGQSTRTPAHEALCALGIRLWGKDELVDAREALQIIGHPAGKHATPVWAASHPRAVAEMVMPGITRCGRIDEARELLGRMWPEPTAGGALPEM